MSSNFAILRQLARLADRHAQVRHLVAYGRGPLAVLAVGVRGAQDTRVRRRRAPVRVEARVPEKQKASNQKVSVQSNKSALVHIVVVIRASAWASSSR